MTISTAELSALIRDIECEDPIDYADLPYAEEELRGLVCAQIREMATRAAQLDDESRQTMLLAVAAKLVLENLVLHLRLLRSQGTSPEQGSEALFRRLRGA